MPYVVLGFDFIMCVLLPTFTVKPIYIRGFLMFLIPSYPTVYLQCSRLFSFLFILLCTIFRL